MTLLNKGIIATSTIGAIGGVGAYAGGLFDSPKKEKAPEAIKTTISKQLEKEGFKVLDTDTLGQDWNDVLAVYITATSKTFSGLAENTRSEKELRDKCKEIINLESSADYPKAKIWCVKKEKMNKVLDRGGFKVLTSSGAVIDGEQDAWKQKIQELKNLEDKPFEGLGEKIKDGDEHLSTNIEALRTECEKIKTANLYTTDENFENNLNLSKKWCSIQG